MTSFFIIASALLLAVHSYLIIKLRIIVLATFWQALAVIGFVLVLLLIISKHKGFENSIPQVLIWVSYLWLGFSLISCVLFLGTDIARFILLFIERISSLNLAWLLSPKLISPSIFIVAIILCGYGVYSAQNIKVNYITLTTNKSNPVAKELRIVALSDIHLSPTIGSKEANELIAEVNKLSADIILIAGDLVDTDMSARLDEAELFHKLQSKYGSYAVLGNHEVYSGLENSKNFIQKANMTLLENNVIQVAGINLIGLEDPAVESMHPDKAAKEFETNNFKELDNSLYTVVMDHRPRINKSNIGLFDLQFSGHTHGGQFWPFNYPTEVVNKVKQGMNHLESNQGKSILYVGNGTGYWGPPIRIGAAPEIVVFDIVYGK